MVGHRTWDAAIDVSIGSAPVIRLMWSRAGGTYVGTPTVADSCLVGFEAVPAATATVTDSTSVAVANVIRAPSGVHTRCDGAVTPNVTGNGWTRESKASMISICPLVST